MKNQLTLMDNGIPSVIQEMYYTVDDRKFYFTFFDGERLGMTKSSLFGLCYHGVDVKLIQKHIDVLTLHDELLKDIVDKISKYYVDDVMRFRRRKVNE